MRIAAGLTIPGLQGGIQVTESNFIRAVSNCDDLKIVPFEFGGRSATEAVLRKVVARLADIGRFVVLLLREKPDVVHLNSSYDKRALFRDVAYSVVSRLMGQALFIKFHGTDSKLLQDSSFVYSSLTRIVLAYSNRIGVLSREEKNNFINAGYNESKIDVVKNVVDMAEPSLAITRLEDPPLLLFIGRFISTKGLLDVIKALRFVRDRELNANLVCVGDGPQRSEAERLVSDLGLEDAVEFTGHIPEHKAADYYFRATILVFPTYHEEGFPMVVFQSLAAGLPIITTRIRAAADYLTDPENCLWVEPKNPKQLGEKIMFLLRDQEMRRQMSVKNKGLAIKFSAQKVAKEYHTLYQDILEHLRNRKEVAQNGNK